MADELDRSRPLFESRVPFKITNERGRSSSSPAYSRDPAASSPPHGEGRSRPALLTVRVLTGTRLVNGLRQPLLHTEITEDADPFFLYSMDVSDRDYQGLKMEQSLVVDFSSFSPHFIDLLRACSARDGEEAAGEEGKDFRYVDSSGSEDPNFTSPPAKGGALLASSATSERRSPLVPAPCAFEAVLDVGTSSGAHATLKIVESNQFKHLTHLALRFQPGTDQTIKTYLAGRLQLCEDRLARAERSYAVTSEHLASQEAETAAARATLSLKESELENLRKSMEVEHKSQMAVQREESAIAMERARTSSEAEIRRLRDRSEEQRSALEAKLDGALSENTELKDERRRLESERDDLQAQVASLRVTSENARKESHELRSQLRETEQAKFECEKLANKFQLQVVALKQQVEDKGVTLTSTVALRTEAQNRLESVTETLNLYKDTAAKLQKKFDMSVAEIKKGNLVIEKMHNELKQAKSKLKLKTTVIKQQEALVDEQGRNMDELVREKDAVARQLAASKETEAQLQRTIEESRQKLAECHKMLESNQNVITYLNKEINEAQMGTKLPLSSSAYTFRPSPSDLPSTYSPSPEAASPFAYGAEVGDIGGGGASTFPGAAVANTGQDADDFEAVYSFQAEIVSPGMM